MKAFSKLGSLSVVSFSMGIAFALVGCGDDEGGGPGTEADRVGVGAECAADENCPEPLVCLTQFKGGYCGLADCAMNEDCPEGSACVAHSDGHAYCFRICVDKSECNLNRSLDAASNC